MDGLASLVAAPISEAELESELRLIEARLDGIEGLASLLPALAEPEVKEPEVPSNVTIENADGGTIIVNVTAPATEIEETDIGDDALDAEIAYQVDFFRVYGYWPSGNQSGATLSPEQSARVKMLAPLMVSDPDAPTSVAIRDRLVRKGLLYSLGA
jgi:hypothetical protein